MVTDLERGKVQHAGFQIDPFRALSRQKGESKTFASCEPTTAQVTGLRDTANARRASMTGT